MTHAWCHDVARDAAVRAAEDNRTGPLPTLEEAISSPFAKAAERSSTVIKTGDGQSGLRRERFTLEVTHDLDARLSDWIVEVVDESLGLMESVRVVDEPSSDADAEMLRRALATSEIKRLKAEAERDALRASFAEEPKLAPHANAVGGSNHATQAASGGGEGEPVADAWGVVVNGSVESVIHRRFRRDAESSAEHLDGTVVPIYRAPPQPRGWLTEEERRIVKLARAHFYETCDTINDIEVLVFDNLLARSSPPVVVWPERCPRGGIGETWERARDGMWLAALAAAGVAVKEVGK